MRSGITWCACPLYSILVKGTNLSFTDPRIFSFSIWVMLSYNYAIRWSFLFLFAAQVARKSIGQ
jgi:hypothetical protein